MRGNTDSSATAESFSRLLQDPYQQHLAAAQKLTDRGRLVAALSPEVLVDLVRDGANAALEQYGSRLAPATSTLVGLWLQQHVKLADELHVRWQRLSAGSGDLVRGFKAGMFSEQAAVGSAIGALLGGWGGVVGRVVGGLVALQHDDRDSAEQLKLYVSEVDRWFAVLASDFDRRVLPQIERDLHPWPHRVRWAATALVSLGVAAALAWLLR